MSEDLKERIEKAKDRTREKIRVEKRKGKEPTETAEDVQDIVADHDRLSSENEYLKQAYVDKVGTGSGSKKDKVKKVIAFVVMVLAIGGALAWKVLYG